MSEPGKVAGPATPARGAARAGGAGESGALLRTTGGHAQPAGRTGLGALELVGLALPRHRVARWRRPTEGKELNCHQAHQTWLQRAASIEQQVALLPLGVWRGTQLLPLGECLAWASLERAMSTPASRLQWLKRPRLSRYHHAQCLGQPLPVCQAAGRSVEPSRHRQPRQLEQVPPRSWRARGRAASAPHKRSLQRTSAAQNTAGADGVGSGRARACLGAIPLIARGRIAITPPSAAATAHPARHTVPRRMGRAIVPRRSP